MLAVVRLYELCIFEIFDGAWVYVCLNHVVFKRMIGACLFSRCSLFSTRILKYFSAMRWIYFKHECMTLRGCSVGCIGHQ